LKGLNHVGKDGLHLGGGDHLCQSPPKLFLDFFAKNAYYEPATVEARKMSTDQSSQLAVYEGKQIRKIFDLGEWWFSIIDVIDVLVRGDRPRK
jgi:hypothetical protein